MSLEQTHFFHTHRIAIITGIICVGLGFIAGRFTLRDNTTEGTGELSVEGEIMTGTTTATGSIERGIHVYEGVGETIDVVDQKAGNEVYVAGAVLAHSGWVAVREEKDGEGGNILGAAWFDEGTHEGIVPLLRETMPGERYHAFLFFDDGDKIFDMTKDIPITKNGLLVLQPFTTF
ncbi:MAG: hypothetical protein KBD16_01755 [Candidatus Pacebacteria bacterium]|nr:hypothetical protein [Candidatus Paceibacterota bacterium]